MLPFLAKQKHQSAGVIMKTRKPDETSEKTDESGDDAGLEAAAHDLHSAVHSGDIKGIASALRAAFEILDSMPHEEGPHTNDYDSQNELAAKENR